MRNIREEEKVLIDFLLYKLDLNPADYPYNKEVDPYEGDVMGSISLGGNVGAYDRDLVQEQTILLLQHTAMDQRRPWPVATAQSKTLGT